MRPTVALIAVVPAAGTCADSGAPPRSGAAPDALVADGRLAVEEAGCWTASAAARATP